jgi:hypothetical protein
MGSGFRVWTAGEVVSAANVNNYLQEQTVMVFADSTARGSAIASPSEGMLTYNIDTGSLELYDGASFIGVGKSMSKRIEAFTASGTWTVPTGVTYAIANMIGGGGGIGQAVSAGNGGASSVAFAGGTVSAAGGSKGPLKSDADSGRTQAQAPPANSGRSPSFGGDASDSRATSGDHPGSSGAFIVAGAAVTPAASITVTVGAGGTAGTGAGVGMAGASGYVYIEYYE